MLGVFNAEIPCLPRSTLLPLYPGRLTMVGRLSQSLPCPLAPGWIGYRRKSKGGRRERSGYLFPWFLPWGIAFREPEATAPTRQSLPYSLLRLWLPFFFFFLFRSGGRCGKSGNGSLLLASQSWAIQPSPCFSTPFSHTCKDSSCLTPLKLHICSLPGP